MKQISLTGIKPTGTPHIGNYLGAIKPALNITDKYQALYFIADYHALTTAKDKQLLSDQIYEVAATWIAAGLNPDEVIFYKQSDIPELFELNWILSCFAPKGMLNRAHSYKSAMDQNLENNHDADAGINCGHYNYPILMAADILMFGSHVVPVGMDQKQHLEMTRDVAHSFNQNYKKEIFRLPEPLIQESVKTIPGIDGRKMSKSYNNQIPLYVTSKKLRKSVMRILTDSKGVDESKDPDKCVLFSIYQYFASKKKIDHTRSRYLKGGMGYGELKNELFELIDESLRHGRKKYDELMDSKEEIDRILAEGAKKARLISLPMIQKIRTTIGISS